MPPQCARTCKCCVFAKGSPSVKLIRLIEQACGCSMVRGGGGLQVEGVCSSLSLALWWRVRAATMIVHAPTGVVPLQRSRHEAPPTASASLRLLHGARWRRRTQGACSSLPLALGWRVLAATTIKKPAGCLPLQGSRREAPPTD